MLRWITNTFRRLIGERPPTPPRSPSTPPAQRQQQPTYHHQTPPAPSPQFSDYPPPRRSGLIDYYDNEYRKKAIEEDRLMKECFEKATEARRLGDYKDARGFVEEANRHKAEKEAANKKGVEFVLSKNPLNTEENKVDLHGLKVDEALEVVKERLSIAKALGCQEYHIITGRGSHSKDHQPKIKPKILEYLRNMKYCFMEDKCNPGSLTVYLELDQ